MFACDDDLVEGLASCVLAGLGRRQFLVVG